MDKIILGQKIKQFRLEKKLTGQQLADHWRGSASFVSAVEQGKKYPGYDMLSALRSIGMSIDDLLGGLMGKVTDKIEGSEFVSVPRYGVSVSAGGGSLVGSEEVLDYMRFRRDWLVTGKGLNPANLLMVNVVGDSMEPTLSEGDMVLVDTVHAPFKSDGVYIVQEGDRLWVKRVQYCFGGELTIKSDNKKYDPWVFREDELNGVRIIGRVVLKIGDLR